MRGVRFSRHRLAVLVLACALFVVTTSEFQVAAMLTDMAADLGVAVADLGLLVSIYSVGMALGGPAVAWVLRRQRPKTALVVVMSGYALAEAAASSAPDPAVLGMLRAVTGALSGATFGIALSAAMATSERVDHSRVTATVLTGLMAGTLLGLPLSHVLAIAAGWRVSFVVLAGAAALMAVAVVLTLPPTPSPTSSPGPDGRGGSAGLRSRTLWLRYLASFLTIGGSFSAFAFIDPLLAGAGLVGYPATAAMVGFGVAAFVVNALTGRVRQGAARRWLLTGLVVQLATVLIFLVAGPVPVLIALATVLLGATGIALNPLLVNRVLTVAAPDVLVNTVHTSAITLGVAVATAIASGAATAGGSLAGPLVTGAGFTVAAVVVVAMTSGRGARASVPETHRSP